MKFEIEVDIPEGYEPTGEYRTVEKGELYYYKNKALVHLDNHRSQYDYIVLRKKKWVPKIGEKYFCIRSTSIYVDTNADCPTDIQRIAIGNCFQTKEEAQAKFEKFLDVLRDD